MVKHKPDTYFIGISFIENQASNIESSYYSFRISVPLQKPVQNPNVRAKTWLYTS